MSETGSWGLLCALRVAWGGLSHLFDCVFQELEEEMTFSGVFLR